jgi:putative ABC transport system ATP-binding protein
MPQLAIDAQHLHKTFGQTSAAVHALRGVSLEVEANQLMILAGPSGCGKTTLVSILSGTLSPDAGAVNLFGVDWQKLSADEKTRRRGELVGFVFQDFNLIPTLNVVENVAVPLQLKGRAYRAARRDAAAMLETVGLSQRTKDRPGDLSGGMQQRVAIARALVAKPRLLVCDEPTANLDGRTGHHIMELLQRASREGHAPRCVLVVSHDHRVFRFADRIEEMEDGLIKPEPSPEIIEHWREGNEPAAVGASASGVDGSTATDGGQRRGQVTSGEMTSC